MRTQSAAGARSRRPRIGDDGTANIVLASTSSPFRRSGGKQLVKESSARAHELQSQQDA